MLQRWRLAEAQKKPVIPDLVSEERAESVGNPGLAGSQRRCRQAASKHRVKTCFTGRAVARSATEGVVLPSCPQFTRTPRSTSRQAGTACGYPQEIR